MDMLGNYGAQLIIYIIKRGIRRHIRKVVCLHIVPQSRKLTVLLFFGIFIGNAVFLADKLIYSLFVQIGFAKFVIAKKIFKAAFCF